MNQFRTEVARHLLPMLPGAQTRPEVGSDAIKVSKYASCGRGAVTIKIRPTVPSEQHLTLTRAQRFFEADIAVARAFSEEFHKVMQSGVLEGVHREELIAGIPQRVVVRIAATVGGLSVSGGRTLAMLLSALRGWASQTYEGQPIASGLAIDAGASATGISFPDFERLPAAKVICDGVTSFCSFDADGNLASFESLADPDESQMEVFRYPHAFRRPAVWTGAGEHRVAVSLTRRGEVLVFAGAALQFASRRGAWLNANHDGAIATWTKVHAERLRRAIYATALDASFARSGACIAVLQNHRREEALSKVVNRADVLTSQNAKARLLTALVRGARFQDLERDVRRQLVAIDGSTILSADGTVIAAGAIVSLPGGSEAGARLAATRRLAHYGFAVKVSADGEIRAHQGGESAPVFEGL